MPFHNELSSDIAIALLTNCERSEAELNTLKETVLTVHETLRQLGDEAKRRPYHDQTGKVPPDTQFNFEKGFVAKNEA